MNEHLNNLMLSQSLLAKQIEAAAQEVVWSLQEIFIYLLVIPK